MSETSKLTLSFLRRQPAAAARTLETLPAEQAARFLERQPPRLVAPVIAAMLPPFSARCLGHCGDNFLQQLLPVLPHRSGAALLRRLPLSQREHMLNRLPAHAAFSLRLLLRYPTGTVGAWMDPKAPMLAMDMRCADALARLKLDDSPLDRYLYVVDREHRLQGRLRSDDLLRANPDLSLERLMHSINHPLQAREALEQALQSANWPQDDPLPVVSRNGRLLGIARHAVLHHAVKEGASEQTDSVFTDALLQLIDAYWSGMARLLDTPFSRRPRDPNDKR